MKNKGFTVVELLATVVLIGIISLVALGSYSGIKKTIMKAQTKNVVSNIESTAIIYSTSRDRVGWVPLTELVVNEFIDKTDLERIDEYEDEKGKKCYLLSGEGDDAVINTEVGVFIGQKFAQTKTTTSCDPEVDPSCDPSENYSVDVSESANLVKTATFYCEKEEREEDQVKYGTVAIGTETSSRFRNYSLDIVDEADYVIVHLSCTNGVYRYPDDPLYDPNNPNTSNLVGGAPFTVNDMTASDSCSLLLYSESKGIYKKYTYLMSGGS